MPTATDMEIDSIELTDVVGKAYRRGRGVTTTEQLDGSSINVAKREHLVSFVLEADLLPMLKSTLLLNETVTFSARYSTGERVDKAAVVVIKVEPLDSDAVEYTLAVGPGEAVLDAPAPG